MRNVLEQIRGSITKEVINNEVKAIREEEFSPALKDYIEQYKIIGRRKDIFVFEWCFRINKTWTVLNVLDEQKNNLRDIKTLLNIFVVQIDDISEEKGNDDLLRELLKIPYEKTLERDHLNQEDNDYLQLTIDVWNDVVYKVKELPLYEKYKGSFDFDILQLIDAVKYGKFITDNKYHMTETEYWKYFPYSMQIIINADLDLMCTPSFEENELGIFRETILTTQKMARIGNWLTTWQREVKSGDYTSIVIPYAINKSIISYDDLENSDLAIKKILESDADDHFLNEWQLLYTSAKKTGEQLKSSDQKLIFDRFEYLLRMHLISQNLK